jgi:hypothetical protein
MAWTYSNWEEQATASAQRTRLILFRTELRDALTAKTTSDGDTYDPATIQSMLEMTNADLKRVDAQVDAENGTGMPRMVSTITPRGSR